MLIGWIPIRNCFEMSKYLRAEDEAQEVSLDMYVRSGVERETSAIFLQFPMEAFNYEPMPFYMVFNAHSM